MNYRLAIAFLLSCGTTLSAQVFELRAGDSSLLESQGASVNIRSGSYDASFGAGKIGPKYLGSASVIKRFTKSTLTLGTATVPFNLPTDVFDEDHYLTVLGASIQRALPTSSMFLFGGMISENVEGPYFQATIGEQPAAIFLYDGQLSPTLSSSSRMIVSKQVTAIEGLAWRPKEWVRMAASGGIGSGNGYGAFSAKVTHSWFDFKTEYVAANGGFRRANVDTILTAEPDRLNARLTLRPAPHLTIVAGHSNYIVPVAGSSSETRSSIDQVEGNTEFKGTSMAASLFHSTYEGGVNDAGVLSASRNLRSNVHVQTSYLYSKTHGQPKTATLVTNISETLSPRWTISQILNSSAGQSTVGFGASFISNVSTISADYETYYLPGHLPSAFEQLLIVNADLNLFGRATLKGGTFVAPNGSLQHTLSAEGVVVRGNRPPQLSERNLMGKYVLSGRVLDEHDQPVEGAALLIDNLAVYTDSDGNFTLRERQSHFHTLAVLNDKFLDGGKYRVTNAPTHIRSSASADFKTVIKVAKTRACEHDASCKA